MTLRDLYDRLDWSGTDDALERWIKTHPDAETVETDPDWKITFRCVLLEQALYGTAAVRQEAKAWLATAGVWPQAVRILTDAGLLAPIKSPKRPKRRRKRRKVTSLGQNTPQNGKKT